MPDPVFVADVREHLLRTPRQLPATYFYDALGSALFDAICRLPWYRITRAETSLLARHGREMLAGVDRPLSIAELGCGTGEKLSTLLSAAGEPVALVQLIDISQAALDLSERRLEAHAIGRIDCVRTGYDEGLAHLRDRARDGARAILFLGSNIGNFDRDAAAALLRRIRCAMRSGDVLLLGADLVKPERDLLLAYDDPLQVTAAFNRNILRRLNDELGADFDLDRFAHRAVWNAAGRRVEMHLVSRGRQHVEIPVCGLELDFDDGETIWTESSHKYEQDEIVALGLAAGLCEPCQWVDEDARFAVTRFAAAPPGRTA